jgi:DNA-binding XRE family transcriptional regulator
MYYTPRLQFVHAGSLRYLVRSLSVETADIFLILMSRIAALDDPKRGIATISMEDIAKLRGVHIRHGGSRELHEDFKAEILRLADLRLTMGWRDYKTGGEVIFGKERPDRLLDILDVEYKISGSAWKAFRFRCGLALSHFLDPEGLYWIGYYARTLLQLSPYHDAFTKKLGTYWIMVGTVAGKKGLLPRATPRTILDFCGEEANRRNPGQTVDAFIASHQRLQDLGVLANMPALEPATRAKGYFTEWLDTPLTVKLAENLWRIKPSTGAGQTKRLAKRPAITGIIAEQGRPEMIPEAVKDLTANQSLIKRFRTNCGIHQTELAKALGICRQTLSRYERGLHSIPEDKALKFLRLWHNKVKPVS